MTSGEESRRREGKLLRIVLILMDRGLDPAYSPCSGDGHNRRLQRNRGPTVYRDNTLIPSEAVRLLSLGMLAGRPMSYAELARSVRPFTGRVLGPPPAPGGAPPGGADGEGPRMGKA